MDAEVPAAAGGRNLPDDVIVGTTGAVAMRNVLNTMFECSAHAWMHKKGAAIAGQDVPMPEPHRMCRMLRRTCKKAVFRCAHNICIDMVIINMYSAYIHIKTEAYMKASIVDLRYKMRDILKALDRNERVTILYHGKIKGVINPFNAAGSSRIREHPFFGMHKNEHMSVEKEMEKMRGGRTDDI